MRISRLDWDLVDLSHVDALVLAMIGGGVHHPRKIQGTLVANGYQRTAHNTRTILKRLKKRGDIVNIGTNPPHYRLTGSGRAALDRVLSFYADLCEDAVPPPSGQPLEVPPRSHVQVRILYALELGEWSGRDIRAELEKLGRNTSNAAFYMRTLEMERAGLIVARTVQLPRRGRFGGCQECLYSLTESGQSALSRARDFYAGLYQARDRGWFAPGPAAGSGTVRETPAAAVAS